MRNFDDGSSDDSVKIIKKKSNKIKFQIIHKKNSGHGDTCRYGYDLILKKYKYFDYILQIDSDNQCDPKYLIEICNSINKNNYEFIFGYRYKRQDGLIRFLLSRILSSTVFLKKFIFIPDLNTPYRIMKFDCLKKIMKKIKHIERYKNIELFNCILTYCIQKHYNICWININFRNRYFGTTKYNFGTMLKMYLNLLIRI